MYSKAEERGVWSDPKTGYNTVNRSPDRARQCVSITLSPPVMAEY